jgi:hypothetical protein
MNPPDLSGERLWTVCKGARSFAAELSHAHRRWELRFVSDGQLFASQSLSSRELAIHCAKVMHNELAADGWVKAQS